MNIIKKGLRCVWNGNDEFRGLNHTVISASKNEIVTWSDGLDGPEIGGFSWLGTLAEFRNQFAIPSSPL